MTAEVHEIDIIQYNKKRSLFLNVHPVQYCCLGLLSRAVVSGCYLGLLSRVVVSDCCLIGYSIAATAAQIQHTVGLCSRITCSAYSDSR